MVHLGSLAYTCLLGFATLVASARFINTINLGTVLISIMLVIGFAWASRKDKRAERWESLYKLADTERKEKEGRLNEALTTINSQRDTITRLDALQMPVKIVELMNESVHRIDDAARARLEVALDEVKKINDDHEMNAEDRSLKLLSKLQEVIDRLPPLIHGGL